ncbi:MAG: Lon protease family protein [Planctomycetota bacterium]
MIEPRRFTPLSSAALRWRCDPKRLGCESTAEVPPLSGIVGQATALEALRFGIECTAPGQNVFVRGLSGAGRITLVRHMLDELRPLCPTKLDRCFVHNFKEPDRPRLISLPPGAGRDLRRRLRDFARFIRNSLKDCLASGPSRARRDALEAEARAQVTQVSAPLNAALAEAGLALVTVVTGPVSQTAIFPLYSGQPVPGEEFQRLAAQGKVTADEVQAFKTNVQRFEKQLETVTENVREVYRQTTASIRDLVEETTRKILGELADTISGAHPVESVRRFLDEVIQDVIEHRLVDSSESDDEEASEAQLDVDAEDPLELYGINVLLDQNADHVAPIIVEHTPTLAKLLGTVEPEWTPHGAPGRSDYRRIRAGALLRADGGYLVLDARDLLAENGAWKVLVRTLRTGFLEIVPSELGWPAHHSSVKPEPIPVRFRVVLVGDGEIYELLDTFDTDFKDLFKVLADFDSVLDREPEGLHLYAGVLARIVREEQLLHFHAGAVAALVEHGARIAARKGKLTARFARIADLAREASFLAKRTARTLVMHEDVTEAVRRTKRRADLPSRRFQELLVDGTIRVQTRGSVVGQINGLAVIHSGPLTYGFPARITASIGAGASGVIDIEGESQLSGSIHTKGFHILGGLLRHLLSTEHALAFTASLAFEQSYGGIDGDSASLAEACCLLSALAKIPLRQSLAITGAIDQFGHVQAIGSVNEKIEGFFDTCAHVGLTGDQGVIIPLSNAGDLMLRPDVVAAAATGKFHIYAIETVQDAIELLTGIAAGVREKNGGYPAGTVLDHAVQKTHMYYRQLHHSPPKPARAKRTDAAPRAAAKPTRKRAAKR